MQSVTELCDGLVMISVTDEVCSAQRLSEAEREVIQLALRGHSNRAIAVVRRCSGSTIANQLASAYHKLRISGRRELRAKASR
jgi:DNA-binding CsgD family transcriptional regulator